MFAQAKPLSIWGQLGEPSEIILTGGEPQIDPFLGGWISGARMFYPDAKVYLYTTMMIDGTTEKHMLNIHGIQYTIHTSATAHDAYALERLQAHIQYRKTIDPFSARLVIVRGANVNFQLETNAWDSIRLLDWIPNCPLPKDETLWIAKTAMTAPTSSSASESDGKV
jgi:hypothetical protein